MRFIHNPERPRGCWAGAAQGSGLYIILHHPPPRASPQGESPAAHPVGGQWLRPPPAGGPADDGEGGSPMVPKGPEQEVGVRAPVRGGTSGGRVCLLWERWGRRHRGIMSSPPRGALRLHGGPQPIPSMSPVPDTVLKNLQTASGAVRTAARGRELLELWAPGVGAFAWVLTARLHESCWRASWIKSEGPFQREAWVGFEGQA